MIPQILCQSHVKQKLFIGTACIILLGVSFASGALFSSSEKTTQNPLQFTQETNPGVPFLTIHGINQQQLVMSTKEIPIRIMYGDTAYNAPSNSEFQLYLSSTGATIPEGDPELLNTPCIYIGAKTGKYIYEAESSQAARIKNGKCFATIADGEEAGYTLYDK